MNEVGNLNKACLITVHWEISSRQITAHFIHVPDGFSLLWHFVLQLYSSADREQESVPLLASEVSDLVLVARVVCDERTTRWEDEGGEFAAGRRLVMSLATTTDRDLCMSYEELYSHLWYHVYNIVYNYYPNESKFYCTTTTFFPRIIHDT
jgi:hypothetical protein